MSVRCIWRHGRCRSWPTTLDPQLKIAAGPFAKRDLRIALEQHPDSGVRERGLAALDRLEAARDAVASAPPERLLEALADLDAVFVELTGREPVRNAGRAYGARTLCYLDCIRDLDVTIGPAAAWRDRSGASGAVRGRELVLRPGK